MSARPRRGPRVSQAPPLAPLCCFSAALGMLWSPTSQAFNLDVDKLTVYSGPEGSYFGYAVDFHIPAARTASVLVGAPKANTSQPDIVEGGAVYYCPWPDEGSAQCRQIPFDNTREDNFHSKNVEIMSQRKVLCKHYLEYDQIRSYLINAL